MATIGIIIVTYNSGAEIGHCLDAALSTGAEIVVIDNASTDDTVLQVGPRPVRLITNSTNRGFAAAVNQGFHVLQCPYVLLLNPDSQIVTSLEPLRAVCDLPGCAGGGGRLLDENGQPQIGFLARSLPTPASLILESLLLNRVWPSNPVNRRYRLLGQDYSAAFQVEQPAGAFLMVRREVWQDLGGFDEGFHPLWFEDVDFCRRIQQRGLVLYYIPESVAKHTGGHSIQALGVEMRRGYWYRSQLRYSSKHFGRLAYRVVCAGVVLGSILRSLVEPVQQRSWKPFTGYGQVIRLAGRCLLSGIRP